MPSENADGKAKEVVATFKERTARYLKDLYECIHHQPADRCGVCNGRTRNGISVAELTAELKAQRLVAVEFNGDGKTPPPARQRPSLKTIAGLGAAGIFIGIIGWRNGKVLLRAIRRNPGGNA